MLDEKYLEQRAFKRFHSSYIENPLTGCFEWTKRTNHQGYGRPYFRGRQQYAHRIAWQLINGPIPDGLFVCHTCDNPKCVNVKHLFLGTKLDNSHDMIKKGRHFGRHKITAMQAKEIFESDKSISDLSIIYGLSHQAITCIRKGRNWAKITGGSGRSKLKINEEISQRL